MLFILFPCFIFNLQISNDQFQTELNGECSVFDGTQQTLITSSCQTSNQKFTKNNKLYPIYYSNTIGADFKIQLDNCNFSNIEVQLGRHSSLINLNGTNQITLNINYCSFENNKMTVEGDGVFYFNGPHIITLCNSIFLSNKGAKASIMGETCSKLTIFNCYFASNTANNYQGQILLSKWNELTVPINITKSTFYMNELSFNGNTDSIMNLNGFASLWFEDCYFTCKDKNSRDMINIQGNDPVAAFTNCCFMNNISPIPYNFYHIYIASGAYLKLFDKNSFNFDKKYAYNIQPFSTDSVEFNINQCPNPFIVPTKTIAPTKTKIPTRSPTETVSFTSTQSYTSEITVTETTKYTSEITVTETAKYTSEFISPTDPIQLSSFDSSNIFTPSQTLANDDSSDGDKNSKLGIYILIGILLFIVLIVVIAIIIGIRCRDRCSEENVKLEKSDSLTSSLISDFPLNSLSEK